MNPSILFSVLVKQHAASDYNLQAILYYNRLDGPVPVQINKKNSQFS